MGMFKRQNVEKYSLGSGVAPQTPIPLYLIGQQSCFGMPGMGVLELHNAYGDMGVWDVTPEAKQRFLALCSSKTTIRGIKKHLFWPTSYRGTVVWGAIPGSKQYVLALCSSHSTILGIQKQLCWPMGYKGMGVWGANSEPKQGLSALSKNTFADLWSTQVCVFGALLQNPINTFWHCALPPS